MRVIEQVEALVLGLTDQFLIDGSTGTRRISFENLLKAINEKISWMSLWGENIPVEARRNIWRGKNLGSAVTQTQWNEIKAGTFKGLFLGDYWEIENRIWRIVDFDYWRNSGDISCRDHHLVIMPDQVLYTAKMNDTNITTGGYVGSKMYTEGLSQAKLIINDTFGGDHILNHRELLVNSVTNGYSIVGSWYDSTVEIPNEIMMYGSYILTPGGNGSITPYRFTIDKTQLAAMKAHPKLINPTRESQWLRDVVSTTEFAYIDYRGYSSRWDAGTDFSVRPVFGIKGEDE